MPSVVAEPVCCNVIELGVCYAHLGHEDRIIRRPIIGSISFCTLEPSHLFHNSRLDKGTEVFRISIADQRLHRLDNVLVQSE